MIVTAVAESRYQLRLVRCKTDQASSYWVQCLDLANPIIRIENYITYLLSTQGFNRYRDHSTVRGRSNVT